MLLCCRNNSLSQCNVEQTPSLPFFSSHWIHLIPWREKPNVLLRSAKVNAHQMAEKRISVECGEAFSWKYNRLEICKGPSEVSQCFTQEKTSSECKPSEVLPPFKAVLSHGASPMFYVTHWSRGNLRMCSCLTRCGDMQTPHFRHCASCWAHTQPL